MASFTPRGVVTKLCKEFARRLNTTQKLFNEQNNNQSINQPTNQKEMEFSLQTAPQVLLTSTLLTHKVNTVV